MATSASKCPDCGGNLAAIKLFGRAQRPPLAGDISSDSEVVYYANPNAKTGLFLGKLKEAGTVRTTLCEKCHRIFLHGEPR